MHTYPVSTQSSIQLGPRTHRSERTTLCNGGPSKCCVTLSSTDTETHPHFCLYPRPWGTAERKNRGPGHMPGGSQALGSGQPRWTGRAWGDQDTHGTHKEGSQHSPGGQGCGGFGTGPVGTRALGGGSTGRLWLALGRLLWERRAGGGWDRAHRQARLQKAHRTRLSNYHKTHHQEHSPSSGTHLSFPTSAILPRTFP